jgi:hypothetical protein
VEDQGKVTKALFGERMQLSKMRIFVRIFPYKLKMREKAALLFAFSPLLAFLPLFLHKTI